MKKILKALTLILALCQIVCSFAACKNDDGQDEAVFELTSELLSSYTIVVPKNDGDMKDVATKLQGIVEKAVGKKLEIKTDKESDGVAEYEIYVGRVQRAEAELHYPALKADDYGYALEGKKLIILGHSAENAEQGVMKLKLEVLDKANGVLLKSGDKNVGGGSYEYANLTVNGVDISKYKIVFPFTGIKGESDAAKYIQAWISEKTGYVLPIVSDEEAASEYEIVIGESTRVSDGMRAERSDSGYKSGKAYIGVTGNSLWISGNSRTDFYMAFRKFISLVEKSNGSLTFSLEKSKAFEVNQFSLSVMDYNVYYDLNEAKRNPDDVIVSVKEKNPDIFGLNEAGMDWINKFKADSEIVAEYACAEGKPVDNSKDASYNPIFYRKDMFELVEGGTKWLSDTPDRMSKYKDAKHYQTLTYVILKDKASGEELMYVNVHFDGSNDADAHSALKEVRKKQAEVLKSFVANYIELPIIIGGDFNEGQSSGVISGMSVNTRLKYCSSIADKAINIGTTDINSDFTEKTEGVVFDYLFVTSDCITVQKYEQWDNVVNGKYPSDHLPVCAEISIKY